MESSDQGVVSFELVTPNGEMMVVHKGDDLFDAAITSLELQLDPQLEPTITYHYYSFI